MRYKSIMELLQLFLLMSSLGCRQYNFKYKMFDFIKLFVTLYMDTKRKHHVIGFGVHKINELSIKHIKITL